MKFLNISILLFSVLLFSCNSTNKSVSSTSENTTQMEAKKMIEDGFTKGLIVTSKVEGDCPITIQVDGKDGPYYFDPINLEDSYKNEGEKIWFKFGGLRMMNRCIKANPVSIIEIQKRVE